MKLEVYYKQRNYNFLELIRHYNKIIDKFGAMNYITDKDYNRFVKDVKSSFIGNNAKQSVSDLLLATDDFEDSYNLFHHTDDYYYILKEKKITPPASKEEALIVYSMLQNGDFDLFIDNALKEKLSENLNEYFDNKYFKRKSINPFNLYDFVEEKGKSLQADNINDIKSNYEDLRKAIDNKITVKFNYHYNDKVTEYTIRPVGFIYSQLEQKMKVKGLMSKNRVQFFYISYIDDLRMVNDESIKYTALKKPEKFHELVFSFENTKGLAERVAARFSDYKKRIDYDKFANKITYHIFYQNTPNENNRVLYRLRSLGKNIKVLGKDGERIKKDAKKALALYD